MGKVARNGLTTKLHLKVTAKTQLGQTVLVTGSSCADTLGTAVGDGESLEMVTTPKEWPVWRTKKPIIIARNVPHEYTYSLRGGESETDESECDACGGRMRVVCSNDVEVHCEDVFGKVTLQGSEWTASFASAKTSSAARTLFNDTST